MRYAANVVLVAFMLALYDIIRSSGPPTAADVINLKSKKSK